MRRATASGSLLRGGLGDLAAEFALAVLKLTAAQRSDGSVEKLGGEQLVILHEDRHEEGAILLRQREGHEIGAFGESLENGVDEGFGAQSLVKLLGAEGVIGLLGRIVDLLLAVLVLEGKGKFTARGESLKQNALGFGEGRLGGGRELGCGAGSGDVAKFLAQNGRVDLQFLRDVGGEFVADDAAGNALDVRQEIVDGFDLALGGAGKLGLGALDEVIKVLLRGLQSRAVGGSSLAADDRGRDRSPDRG